MSSFGVESTGNVLRSLVGESLQNVSYLYSSDATTPILEDAGHIHEVPYGVRLVTSQSVPITLTWLMEGDCEALVAVEGTGEDVGITDLIEAHDVSASPRWRPLLGPAITNAGISWHRATLGCPATPWACRLEFGNQGGFVAALAETYGETLEYQPDNVAVLFDRRDAEALR
ncbi:MAG: hypothetical protein QOH97_1510, partial [Actinoplanes sp.]|nr:hypothetical protein [Actinoplanes sp.]